MKFSQTQPFVTRIYGTLCLGLAVALIGVATSNSHADEMPSAESILDRHVEAIGGEQAHLRFKSRKSSGTFTSDVGGHNLKAKIVIQALAPNKSHMMLEGGPIAIVRVCNGTQAWEWNAGHRHGSGEHSHDEQHLAENTRLMSGPDKARAIKNAQFHSSVQWRKNYDSYETVGLEDVKGQPAYKLQLTTNDGDDVTQYYNKENGRLVKSARSVETSNSGTIAMETFYEKYRKFDGIWIATSVQQTLDMSDTGKGMQRWEFDSIEHDTKVPSSLFEMPKGLKN